MVADIERSYTGTNFAAITVILLAISMVFLIAYAGFDNIRDNRADTEDAQPLVP